MSFEKKDNFALFVVLFILLVIIGCACTFGRY